MNSCCKKIGRGVFLIAFSASLFSVEVIAQQHEKLSIGDSMRFTKDFVRMNNGDRLVGKIIKVQRGDLYFDGDQTGDVKIDLRDIRRLWGYAKFYRIEIIGKGQYIGKIEFAENDGFFVIRTATDSLQFGFEEISSLIGFEHRFIERLAGSLNFGYSFTKSSDITRFNMSNELSYTSARWLLGQDFSGIYTVGDGNGLERMDAILKATYDLKRRWILICALQYQKILELGVESRILEVAGVGKKLIEGRHLELNAATGLAGQKEYGIDGNKSGLQMELPLLVNFSLFQLKKPDIDIYSTAVFYYSLSINNRYRLDYKLNFNYEIIKDFKMGFQFFYNYDSKPLTQNTGSSDVGMVFTLGFEF